jgi:hypothetical protein
VAVATPLRLDAANAVAVGFGGRCAFDLGRPEQDHPVDVRSPLGLTRVLNAVELIVESRHGD